MGPYSSGRSKWVQIGQNKSKQVQLGPNRSHHYYCNEVLNIQIANPIYVFIPCPYFVEINVAYHSFLSKISIPSSDDIYILVAKIVEEWRNMNCIKFPTQLKKIFQIFCKKIVTRINHVWADIYNIFSYQFLNLKESY